MLKYFNNIYNNLSDLNHEKRLLSMKLHPDRGGTDKEFAEMMKEYSKIEKVILENGQYNAGNEKIEVEVKFTNEANDFYKKYAEKESFEKENMTKNSNKDTINEETFQNEIYVSFLNNFISKKHLEITFNNLIFSKKVFLSLISILTTLGVFYPIFLVITFLLSLASKKISYIFGIGIVNILIILIFNISLISNILALLNDKMLDIILYIVFLIPLLIILKIVFTPKSG